MKKMAILAAVFLILGGTAAGITIQEDIPSLNVVFQDKTQVYSVNVVNDGNSTQQYDVQISGSISEILNSSVESFTLAQGSEEAFKVTIDTRNSTKELYTGSIIISGEDSEKRIPLGFRVVERSSSEVRLDLQTTSNSFR